MTVFQRLVLMALLALTENALYPNSVRGTKVLIEARTALQRELGEAP